MHTSPVTFLAVALLAAAPCAPAQTGGVPGAVPAAPPAAAAVVGWASFNPPDAGFSVELPGVPNGGDQSSTTPGGVTLKHSLYVLKTGKIEYLVGYEKLPITTSNEDVAKRVFDNARDGTVAQMHARVIDEKSVRVAGWPGREIALVANDTYVRMLSVMIDYEMVSLIVETPGATADDAFTASADRFLGSLKIDHAAN